MPPEISIAVPVFNNAKSLGDCVGSVLAQSFESWELILVDDGSDDESGEICERYAASTPRIKVARKANGGVSSARNSALELATGRYVSFLDADDWLEPEFCSVMFEAAERSEAEICRCHMKQLHESSGVWEIPSAGSGKETLLAAKEGSPPPFVKMLELPNPESVCASLYKRQLLLSSALRFDESIRLCEDAPFAYEAFAAAKSALFVDRALYCYRRSSESRSNAKCSPEAALGIPLILRHFLELKARLGSEYPAKLMAARGIDIACALSAQAPDEVDGALFAALAEAASPLIEAPGSSAPAPNPLRLYRKLAAFAFSNGSKRAWKAAMAWRNFIALLGSKARKAAKPPRRQGGRP